MLSPKQSSLMYSLAAMLTNVRQLQVSGPFISLTLPRQVSEARAPQSAAAAAIGNAPLASSSSMKPNWRMSSMRCG